MGGRERDGGVGPLDDVGHGECLAAAGDPQQGLIDHLLLEALNKALHGLGLVPGHLEIGRDPEIRHGLR